MAPMLVDAGHGVLEQHNLGPKCRLAPVARPFAPAEDDDDAAPFLHAQFFYTSAIPIDDPLSTSTIAGPADVRSARGVLRPFSRGDNNALEKAWLGLASDNYHRNHSQARRSRSPSPSLALENALRLEEIVHELAVKHKEKHTRDGSGHDTPLPEVDPVSDGEAILPLCCQDLVSDVGIQLRTSFCAVARKRQHSLDREKVAQDVMVTMKTLQTDATASVTTRVPTLQNRPRAESQAGALLSTSKDSALLAGSPDNSGSRPSSRRAAIDTQGQRASRAPSASLTARSSLSDGPSSIPIAARPGAVGDGISGKPFVRVGTSDTTHYLSPAGSLSQTASSLPSSKLVEEKSTEREPRPEQHTAEMPATIPERGRRPRTAAAVQVPVGISRLHEVSLPALQMKPIYWSPVNDLAPVLRATWFYKDTMLPIDTAVANQLEAGYRELNPHTQTWRDEIRCAVEVGPDGEEKVSHPLWAQATKRESKAKMASDEPNISSNPFCAARCFRGEAAAEGNLSLSANEDDSSQEPSPRKYEQYHVIYKDERNAFLLKPSLKPSAYYGRRPVAKIIKGITIGIPVVRGFDPVSWARLHEKKKPQTPKASQSSSVASASRESMGRGVCAACRAEKERGQVTDLVLVAHGIGQKLAERVESYHFTHAINAFRRTINIELASDAVRAVLRDGQNGIMVLPVNWRQNLSFEEGGPMREGDKAEYTPGGFGLKNIEPPTIPAVRSMVSDIMFDIPFYMSHHKPKMISALVGEANRVYRLWCRNNPGFSENGRVHLIGHSLGSAMALEILSRQPTLTPALDLDMPIQLKHFEFDTKNLFLLGSPAAFFLLLERGALLPRRGRLKPGADPAETISGDVVGDAGQFGCLAVDNIYNVLAREDPVAYLLNGTIDPKYSASLKTAYVPSAAGGLFQSMGNVVRSIVPGVGPAPAHETNPAMIRPSTLRLPSQLELEVHDFTREEVAEKKAFLLNDNGQIDYYLRSGGGPLELQYLNMLSAHSSYWASHDLIRMLCMEIGRKPGRENTLPAMRAVKAKRRTLPEAS